MNILRDLEKLTIVVCAGAGLIIMGFAALLIWG